MTTYMTHIAWTDDDVVTPGVDDGIGAWAPLGDDERTGQRCIDCGSYLDLRAVGQCEDGPIRVCGDCYVTRLRDHIDYYRPQSGPSCCDHHAGWADAPACDDGESDGLFDEDPQ